MLNFYKFLGCHICDPNKACAPLRSMRSEIEAKISDSQARNLVRWALRECEIQKSLQHPRGMAASPESKVDWNGLHQVWCDEVIVLFAKCLRSFEI